MKVIIYNFNRSVEEKYRLGDADMQRQDEKMHKDR